MEIKSRGNEAGAELRRTPLYRQHLRLGARMAPFGGFEMPIQYRGIVEEHQAARRQAALFDTCHMGEFHLSGTTAVADLQRLLTCQVETLPVGRCRYGLLCNEAGGVIDDLLLYRLATDEFMLVGNSARRQPDWLWLRRHVGRQTRLLDQSEEIAKIDLQGPAAVPIAVRLMGEPIDNMVFYSFRKNRYRDREILLSRTGYTGEIGFELYLPVDLAEPLWNDCLELGAAPAGLGARDTLRLEMGMPLHGHELSENRVAGEAGLGRAIAADKKFVGSDKVHDKSLLKQSLQGILLTDRRAARQGQTVLRAEDEREIGTVTSGSFAPSLGRAVALAYLDRETAKVGDRILVAAGRRRLEGQVVEPPFYRKATGRAKLARFMP